LVFALTDETYSVLTTLPPGTTTRQMVSVALLNQGWWVLGSVLGALISYALGRFLPLAIMMLLLVHTLVGSARDNPTGPWAEIAAVACVIGLQWRWRQPLLSILLGTALYVLLRNPALWA